MLLRVGSLGLLTICACALALATQARSPDGETPAEESVCDGLADGAAWGLCNA